MWRFPPYTTTTSRLWFRPPQSSARRTIICSSSSSTLRTTDSNPIGGVGLAIKEHQPWERRRTFTATTTTTATAVEVSDVKEGDGRCGGSVVVGGVARKRMISGTTTYNSHRGFSSSNSKSKNEDMVVVDNNRKNNENNEDDSADQTKQVPQEELRSTKPQVLWNTTCTGTGQVLFLNSIPSGQIVLASLCLGDPVVAGLAVLGAATSTLTAQAAHLGGTNASSAARTDGLYSYNGCLVGCAAAVFGGGSLVTATTWTVVGASTAALVTQVLSSVTAGRMPQWTIAFNLVTLTALLRTQPLLAASSSTTSSTADGAAVVETLTTTTTTTVPGWEALLASPLTGLSQIFVVNSAWTGLGIVTAVASYSPLLAVHAVAGSVTGTLVGGLVYGAPAAELAAGLWGYNSALTSMGVAVFFRNNSSPAYYGLSVGGAAVTASLFATLQTVLGMAGSPCLTLPFCVAMSGCYLLGTPADQPTAVVPGLWLAANPHSPERNVSKE